jgi:mannose-6-phosphate isomerase-like protein (cupin superfamily)
LSQPIGFTELPGSDASRQFEGEGHGTVVSFFLIDYSREGQGPELHRHAYDEIFIVDEGRARFTVGDAEREVGGGEIVMAPAGTPHRFANAADERLRLTAIHTAPKMATEWL